MQNNVFEHFALRVGRVQKLWAKGETFTILLLIKVYPGQLFDKKEKKKQARDQHELVQRLDIVVQ